jgi:hypothetical protein
MTPTITPRMHAEWMQQELLEARRRGQEFLERNVLVVLAEASLSGAAIVPEFQALANAVMAKALIRQALPSRQDGRKVGTTKHDPALIATEYFEYIDGVGCTAMTEGDAIGLIAIDYNIDETTVRHYIDEERWLHGNSKAARDQARRNAPYMEAARIADDDSTPVELACLSRQDALSQLDEIIRNKIG